MARYGIAVESEDILVTTGSQQVLNLISKSFIKPGDRLLVEKPTYVRALQAWNACQAEYITIALDDEGLQTDGLEAALRKYFPASARWTTPQGGLFLWVTLPEPIDATAILQAAIAKNVTFVPGPSFFAGGSGHHTLRWRPR